MVNRNSDINPLTGDKHANSKWTPAGWIFDPGGATEDWQRVNQETFEATGIVRWTSNDSVPHSDMLGDFLFIGRITKPQYEASEAARKVDDDKFFAEYRKNQRPLSGEELFEMRAAFGPGETVVDVISGRKTKL